MRAFLLVMLTATSMAQPPMPPRLVVTPINKHPLWRFNVYYGPSSRSYTNVTNVEFPYLGSNTFRIGIAPIPIQTNFYAVTWIDKQYGLESYYSSEVSAKPLLPLVTLDWKWSAPDRAPLGPLIVTVKGGTNSLSITNPPGIRYYRTRSLNSTSAQLLSTPTLGKIQVWTLVTVWSYAPGPTPEPSITMTR